MHPVERVDWTLAGKAIAELRAHVWVPLAATGAPGKCLTELRDALDVDKRSIHFTHVVGSEVVGAARLTINFLPQSILSRVPSAEVQDSALLSRIVVHASYRGGGIAKSLELACIDHAKRLGQQFLWAEASPSTADALLRMGFDAMASYFEAEAMFVNQHIEILRKALRP
jgi:GNAT superfamily N-acetyltransferase